MTAEPVDDTAPAATDVFEQAERDTADHRARIEARARLMAGEHLATIRDLAFVLAMNPFTHWADSPAGMPGRPIGPSDAELGPPRTASTPAEIPRQPQPLRGAAKRAHAERLARGAR